MRQPSLRQIEALMAVVEAGSVSKAAEILSISQPAASKLIAHLEEDTGMQLFDRESGRLVPTERGMRLYEEADRIFGGVEQFSRVIDGIRRQEKGQLHVGVMPGLSGRFTGRIVAGFRRRFPEVFVSVDTRASQYLAEWIVSRRLDIAIMITRVDHANVRSEAISTGPRICLLPLDHPLCEKDVIRPQDLVGEPFIGFAGSSLTRRLNDAVFEAEGLRPNVVLEATTAPNVCEFVALGLGVTIADPSIAEHAVGRVAVRRFVPATPSESFICWPAHSRNSALVEAFVEETRLAAEAIPRELLPDLGT